MTHSSLQKEADSRDNVVIQTGQSTYVPETPSKRRYCETEEQSIGQKTSLRHGRCVADFGYPREVTYDSSQENFPSKIHQSYLMKEVEACIKQLDILPVSNNEENISALVESVDTIAEGMSSLHDDNVLIHRNLVQIQSKLLEQQNQIERCKNSIEESVPCMSAMQLNTSVLQHELETVKQMMADLSFQASNDGTFVWKITDVAQKISDSVTERQTSIYSPPFYSSPTGYKMCMRLYLNGDAQARRTHISLFFVILRGDYDAILPWPFSHKVTYFLYDQSGNQRHITDSFRPDVKSNSFQRPKSNMNIASGIPKFCPLSMITHDNSPYVRDDCMFIRCVVDFASTPKAVTSYVCNINVGLPTRIQNQMIQTEIERIKATTTSDNTENKGK